MKRSPRASAGHTQPLREYPLAIPDTRPSILIRLRDHSDREAWRYFEEVYRGVIARAAVRYGIQEADAADLSQDVLLRVSRAIDRYEYESHDARFRTWLGHVIRSAIADHYRAQPRDQGSGLTEIQDQLAELADDEGQFDALIDQERRGEIFRWAAKRIRGEFAESSWLAFWRTVVEQRPINQVAQELDRSVGAVYTSRSRIMRRLREEVCLFDEEAV